MWNLIRKKYYKQSYTSQYKTSFTCNGFKVSKIKFTSLYQFNLQFSIFGSCLQFRFLQFTGQRRERQKIDEFRVWIQTIRGNICVVKQQSISQMKNWLNILRTTDWNIQKSTNRMLATREWANYMICLAENWIVWLQRCLIVIWFSVSRYRTNTRAKFFH